MGVTAFGKLVRRACLEDDDDTEEKNTGGWKNTKMENILNELMIEQLHSDINYENSYNQCLPFNCTYTYVKRWRNLMHAIVNVIETIGGLSTVLIIITPSIIKLILRIKDPKTRESGK
ncbi:unnamed protein product [Didymodactylos carnosus]|uniref:Uncharacterized protein n=1 Tax=Didymodactylos carnosus TaxID=1234261 RepID=A0A814V3C9_9BILA|nr:unnamed protein product [Didymodactylos carnosus]CAF3948957.1 unnamed protein product [Didymodactylos carnosus]